MTRKLFIVAWFGPLPEWMPHYRQNIEALKPLGYDWLFFHDLPEFKQRCKERLDVDCSIRPGGSKIHDFRPAFATLFRDEIRGYDFWGHTDLDCVYGRVGRWITDEFLDKLDIHSNAPGCVCGPWTLYRNTERVNSLYVWVNDWRKLMEARETSGWIEQRFSRAAEAMFGRRLRYTRWQNEDMACFDTLRWKGERLVEHDYEILMAHFNGTKVYPQGCIRPNGR